MRHRYTDELSDFDMRQMLLLEEQTLRLRETLGRNGARERAVNEVPLVFDLPVLEAAVRRCDPLLPSILATVLGGVSRRNDGATRREAFTGPARDAHITEARRRAAEAIMPGQGQPLT